MSFIRTKLTVSQSLAQHQFMVVRTIERLLESHSVKDLPVSEAVRAWYGQHPQPVRNLLRHEEPLYTALAIVGMSESVARYEGGSERARYLAIVKQALDEWWSYHPELYSDELTTDGRVIVDEIDDVM